MTEQKTQALTDTQIAAQDARYSIDGAIAYGRMGTNQPPAGHWLTEYWSIGQQLAELGKTSAWDNQTPADAPRADHSEDDRQMAAEPVDQIAELIWNWAGLDDDCQKRNCIARIRSILAAPSAGACYTMEQMQEYAEGYYNGRVQTERSASAQQAAVPDGWILVPVHPTKEMRAAGAKINGQGWDFAHHTWNTMLLYAPVAPAPKDAP